MSIGICIKQYIVGAAVAVLMLGSAAEGRAGVMYAITGAGGSSSTLYTIDTNTLATTVIGATGFSHVTGLAVNPVTGNMYGHISDQSGIGGTQLISIDKSTGAGAVIGSTGHQVSDMTFDSSGTLLGWTASESAVNGLISIDLGTGASIYLDPPSIQSSRTGLAFDSSDNLFFKDRDDLFALDPFTVHPTLIGAIQSASTLHNVLEFGDDTLFSISRQGSSFLYTIDTSDGAATLVGDTGIANISALAYEASTVTVAEPGAGVVLGLGLMALGWLHRRRR